MRTYKTCILFLISALATRAQNFTNGQAARAVIGQLSFTYEYYSPSQQIIGGASGLAYANNMLFVADSNRVGALPQNNRVLMFNTSQIPLPDANITPTPFDSHCYLCGYPAQNVLGQPNYTTTTVVSPVSAQTMLTATAVATDGHVLAVADTDNNRVLIWNSIPTSIDAPANIVLGQPGFTTAQSTASPTAQTLRGPQGVWIQNDKLFVADTQNFRVLIWNRIPTQNNQPADLELGQPSFNSANQPPANQSNPTAAANQLLNPVSVTSDGIRLYVADLGFNRVLIWNSIPAAMDQPADVVVGQPDMTSTAANNSSALCSSPGAHGQCERTLNFPRFALSDGNRLFIADGGNDRVLIFNSIPTTNGAAADVVLGQPDFRHDVVTDQTSSIITTAVNNTGSVDTVPTPMSLAFDGTNLYVGDPNNRRILVFTPGTNLLPPLSVLNHGSEIIRQEGVVSLAGTIVAKDTVTVTIAGKAYTYTILSSDTLASVAQNIVNAINAGKGDPNVTAMLGPVSGVVYLSSKAVNLAFDAISLAATTSNTGDIVATASGGYLTAGTAATIAPGTLVEINGTNLSDNVIQTPLTGPLPKEVGGSQVFMDGFAVPIWSVSPSQIIAQVPYSFTDRNSSSVYVRTLHNDAGMTFTNATPITIAPANPGLFSAPASPAQPRPWPASSATHQPYNPSALVSIDGTVHEGDIATITINGRQYNYTVKAGDLLGSIRDALINQINSKPDPQVSAFRGGAFVRVLLIAKQPGQAGTGIPVSGTVSSGAQVTVTAYNAHTCCAVVPGSLITPSNPAVPGEIISLAATGLGLLSPASAAGNQLAGYPYFGPQPNSATNSVSATVNGSTAQIVSAGLPEGSYGVYEIQMLLPTNLPTNGALQAYVAQNAFISNIVTIPVGPPAANGGVPVAFTANPVMIVGAPGTDFGSTTLAWSGAPGSVALYVGNPTNGGTLLTLAGPSGTAFAGAVKDGTTFYLQDATNPNLASGAATLATLTVHVQSSPVTLAGGGQPGNIRVAGDFDGDGKADLAVWRPLDGTWYIIPSGTGVPYSRQWGLLGDVPVPGDFDGDGKSDLAVWRPSNGTWYIQPSSGSSPYLQPWGLPGDIPVIGDFDADGKTDFAVWRPSNGTWYIIPSGTRVPYSRQWGLLGDMPVPADFDGDGKTDLAVWRPSNGSWYIIPSGTGAAYSQPWGLLGDMPVPADFDGDGKTDFAVWRPSNGTWYITPANGAAPYLQQWGLLGDVPLPLDFDGDKKADLTVWRPPNGTWYITPSIAAPRYLQQWGLSGDIPN